MSAYESLARRAVIEIQGWLDELMPASEYDKAGLPKAFYPQILQPAIATGTEKTAVLRHFLDRPFLYLYRNVQVPSDRQVIIFSWIMTHGFGDLIAQYEIAKIIKKRFAKLPLQLISLIHKDASLPFPCPGDVCTRIPFDTNEEMKLEYFPEEVLHQMASSALIFQTPTYYPYTQDLWKKLYQMKGILGPLPKEEILGEYGFTKASWAHPNTEARCLGLHFLEKGILTFEEKNDGGAFDFSHLSSEQLHLIFGQPSLTEEAFRAYGKKRIFAFPYLITNEGHFIYLYALIKSLSRDRRDIDIATPDIGGFLRGLQAWLKKGNAFSHYYVKEIQIYFKQSKSKIPIGKTGKNVRIMHLGPIAPEDFRRLVRLNEGVFGCRGDQSFSHAVSFQKPFFYDGLTHSEPFLLDLLYIIRGKFPQAEELARSVEISLALMETEIDVLALGEELGTIWQSPAFYRAMKQLCTFLKEHYSANDLIGDIIGRSLCHYYHPKIAEGEQKIKEDILHKKISFSEGIAKCRSILYS